MQRKKEKNMSTKPVATLPAVASEDLDVGTLILEASDWFQSMRQTLAGYTALQNALAWKNDNNDEEQPTLPILEFRAATVGSPTRETVTCAIDLGDVPVGHLDHVLVPLINSLAKKLKEAVLEVEDRILLIKPILDGAMRQ